MTLKEKIKLFKDLENVYESAKQNDYTKTMLDRIREELKALEEQDKEEEKGIHIPRSSNLPFIM